MADKSFTEVADGNRSVEIVEAVNTVSEKTQGKQPVYVIWVEEHVIFSTDPITEDVIDEVLS